MKNCNMYLPLFLVLAVVLLSSASAPAQHQNTVLPGPGWQVMRADWGVGNHWVDVTLRVRVLLSGNGLVQASSGNLGQPGPGGGPNKILRIQAQNSRGQSRQFTFNQGDSIDASQFYNYGGGIGNGSGPGLQVMQADWGAGNRRVDVTDRVRAMLAGNGMVKVNNANLGGDPAVGADKVLRISARDMQGQVRQLTYKEGANIDASQFYNYGSGGGYPGNRGTPGIQGTPAFPRAVTVISKSRARTMA
jgi:hypothetical protein